MLEATQQVAAKPLAVTDRGEIAVAAAVYLVGVVLLFLSAPHHGEFWWSDAPRHALNGVFVKDMALAFPWRDPTGFAMQYYVQFPALTILFYPPLFYLVSAPFFAILGVSHATAVGVVLIFYFVLALSLYLFARRWLERSLALAVGLLVMAAPGIALWGRQVMLEIPALAVATWALLVLRRYCEAERCSLLYLGAFLLLCAVYTKITAIFLVPVAVSMVLTARGRAVWRDRGVWIASSLFLIGVVPLAFLMLKFGQANVTSMVGIADEQVSRASLAGWLWYLRQLPEQLGWPVLAFAILSPLLAIRHRASNVDRTDLVLLLAWLVIGYIFFSAIDLKEARHSTLILPPLLVAAGIAIDRLLPSRVGILVAFCLVAITAAYTWRYEPVPLVDGYREAAEWVAREAPRDAAILFSGKRDGSFIFNMRSIESRRDLYTVRADKLLLEVAVRRELGVKEKSLDDPQIAKMLDQVGVQYVVAQSDFWTDLEVMARLQSVLRSDQFEELARIPIVANVRTEDTELRIYRNRHEIKAGAAKLKLDLPIINRSVNGQIGADH